MARGTALSDILAMVKAELMVDGDSDVSPGGDPMIRLQIAMQQKWLALRYEWPFLMKEADVTLTPGTQYYNFPTNVFELGKPIKAYCYFGQLWNEIEPGIEPRHYNYLNPETDQRADPVTQWMFYRDTTLQFEVWPLPATATVIRLFGQMKLPDLAVDADTAELDDILIAQFTAAKLAARMKSADAQALLAQANETLRQLRIGYVSEATTFNTSNQRNMPRDWQRPTVATMITP